MTPNSPVQHLLYSGSAVPAVNTEENARLWRCRVWDINHTCLLWPLWEETLHHIQMLPNKTLNNSLVTWRTATAVPWAETWSHYQLFTFYFHFMEKKLPKESCSPLGYSSEYSSNFFPTHQGLLEDLKTWRATAPFCLLPPVILWSVTKSSTLWWTTITVFPLKSSSHGILDSSTNLTPRLAIFLTFAENSQTFNTENVQP